MERKAYKRTLMTALAVGALAIAGCGGSTSTSTNSAICSNEQRANPCRLNVTHFYRQLLSELRIAEQTYPASGDVLAEQGFAQGYKHTDPSAADLFAALRTDDTMTSQSNRIPKSYLVVSMTRTIANATVTINGNNST